MCKYCSSDYNANKQSFTHGYRKIIIFYNPNPSITVIEHYKDDAEEITMEIEYCPFCGRKLSN